MQTAQKNESWPWHSQRALFVNINACAARRAQAKVASAPGNSIRLWNCALSHPRHCPKDAIGYKILAESWEKVRRGCGRSCYPFVERRWRNESINYGTRWTGQVELDNGSGGCCSGKLPSTAPVSSPAIRCRQNKSEDYIASAKRPYLLSKRVLKQ